MSPFENVFPIEHAHTIHVGYIYLHLLICSVDFHGFHVGKYNRPMDPMEKWRFSS